MTVSDMRRNICDRVQVEISSRRKVEDLPHLSTNMAKLDLFFIISMLKWHCLPDLMTSRNSNIGAIAER